MDKEEWMEPVAWWHLGTDEICRSKRIGWTPLYTAAQTKELPPSDGLELVPAVPTMAMIQAGAELLKRESDSSSHEGRGRAYYTWTTMLAAAPSRSEGR